MSALHPQHQYLDPEQAASILSWAAGLPIDAPEYPAATKFEERSDNEATKTYQQCKMMLLVQVLQVRSRRSADSSEPGRSTLKPFLYRCSDSMSPVVP